MIARLGLRYRGRSIGNAPTCACHSRRDFLAGVGAAGAAAMLSAAAAKAEVASSALRTVDVHHHIYPPRYLSENLEHIAKDIALRRPKPRTGRRIALLRKWTRPA
jgi:hypothetical protein